MSAADQIIAGIILFAALAFIGLLYFDRTVATDASTSSSAQIRDLAEEKRKLEEELERLQNESSE